MCFKEIGHLRYIYYIELDKTYFQNDMSYTYFKDLSSRTISYNALREKPFNIDKNLNFDGC